LAIATAKSATAKASGAPWSDAPFDLNGLAYLDAQARISAAELLIDEARIAPAAFDATLTRGVLATKFTQLGAYGGQANGDLTIDVGSGAPTYALRCELTGVRALPLLSTLAGFEHIDGTMQAKLQLRSAGNSPRAIMAALGGAAFVDFRNGEIRGLNVARMIRSLTASTLSGWQDGATETTDLSQFGASFKIEQGQATTTDLALAGPLVRMTGGGTIDLPNKSLAFRVEPKLVLTTQGQNATANPVGLGIPVMVQGPWVAPQIYPDAAGMLDNPDAAYAGLRQLGQGLFSKDLFGKDGGDLGGLGGTLGTMIQQGLGNSGRQKPGGSPATPEQPQDSEAMNAIMKQLFGR
jgi:AsmA protein